MTTAEVVTLVVTALVLGTVYPLLGVLWYQLVAKVEKLEQQSVSLREFKAHMRRLDESNIRIERAMGILPRDRAYSINDSDPPEGR